MFFLSINASLLDLGMDTISMWRLLNDKEFEMVGVSYHLNYLVWVSYRSKFGAAETTISLRPRFLLSREDLHHEI